MLLSTLSLSSKVLIPERSREWSKQVLSSKNMRVGLISQFLSKSLIEMTSDDPKNEETVYIQHHFGAILLMLTQFEGSSAGLERPAFLKLSNARNEGYLSADHLIRHVHITLCSSSREAFGIEGDKRSKTTNTQTLFEAFVMRFCDSCSFSPSVNYGRLPCSLWPFRLGVYALANLVQVESLLSESHFGSLTPLSRCSSLCASFRDRSLSSAEI